MTHPIHPSDWEDLAKVKNILNNPNEYTRPERVILHKESLRNLYFGVNHPQPIKRMMEKVVLDAFGYISDDEDNAEGDYNHPEHYLPKTPLFRGKRQ